MMRNDHVLQYLQTVEQATLEEIYENVPFGYYHNWRKHLGAMMSRMVKSKKVTRVKRGVFKALTKEDVETRQVDIGLFQAPDALTQMDVE